MFGSLQLLWLYLWYSKQHLRQPAEWSALPGFQRSQLSRCLSPQPHISKAFPRLSDDQHPTWTIIIDSPTGNLIDILHFTRKFSRWHFLSLCFTAGKSLLDRPDSQPVTMSCQTVESWRWKASVAAQKSLLYLLIRTVCFRTFECLIRLANLSVRARLLSVHLYSCGTVTQSSLRAFTLFQPCSWSLNNYTCDTMIIQ